MLRYRPRTECMEHLGMDKLVLVGSLLVLVSSLEHMAVHMGQLGKRLDCRVIHKDLLAKWVARMAARMGPVGNHMGQLVLVGSLDRMVARMDPLIKWVERIITHIGPLVEHKDQLVGSP